MDNVTFYPPNQTYNTIYVSPHLATFVKFFSKFSAYENTHLGETHILCQQLVRILNILKHMLFRIHKLLMIMLLNI